MSSADQLYTAERSAGQMYWEIQISKGDSLKSQGSRKYQLFKKLFKRQNAVRALSRRFMKLVFLL